MREGKRGGRDKEREGEGDQGQERSGCVMGVPVTVHGGELAWECCGGNTQRLCERQQQRQGWQLSEEWCGPWNLLAEVLWFPGIEPEDRSAHQKVREPVQSARGQTWGQWGRFSGRSCS